MKDVKDVPAPQTKWFMPWTMGATILGFVGLVSASIYSGRKDTSEVGFTPAVGIMAYFYHATQ